ncbi:RNA polymerase factor sigma-54 [Paenibacillus piri]|uniref:RNA polymerase factor sigma-54 n=1 Tax=Paenibacillus piri TaxID=2547395 RepID=A0A4R5KUY8_9BACL|nr:RNA polymerase factor sigma-54 [Paenibacillus piri]TDF98740.1 RNA polymerase factor sigma-54 [Paenibacillus piri]
MLPNFKLDQVQTQKLHLTAELKQSIEILQYSALELEQFLHEQAFENPMIEIEDSYGPKPRGSGKRSDSSGDYDRIARLPDRDISLEHWIVSQLLMTRYTDQEYRAVSYLAGNLNESGYLTVDMEEAAHQLELPLPIIEQSLEILHSFDPAGVGSRNAAECLQLQIQRDTDAPPLASGIVANYMEELARGNLNNISRELRVPRSEVESALSYIRKLNPRPCASFGAADAECLVVDAHIFIKPGQQPQIIIKNAKGPKIRLNDHYLKWSEEAEAFSDVRVYVEEKTHAAKRLIRSVEERDRTLQKVISVIVEEQLDFFTGAAGGLKPMILNHVSQKIGMHESTVSRAVRNKYVNTPKGVFELKYFFSSAIQTASDNPESARNVKRRIRLLVDREDKRKPLSDQAIATIFQNEGIQISRRTVAKYRDEERILPSSMRKCR